MTDTESKEMAPLTPGELLALLRPKADSIYMTVKLLIKERDDWKDLCAATGSDLEAVRRERDIALADLASLHTAWEDWKVYHSTSRLEAEHTAELYKLRKEVEHERFLREQAEAMCAQVQDQREDLRQERDDAIADLTAARTTLLLAKDACRLAREGKPIPWSFLEEKFDAALSGKDTP